MDAAPEVAAPQRALEEVEERSAVACGARRKRRCCGDGVCNGPETPTSCPEDCPGVTTDAQCGEEQHSDRGGGRNRKIKGLASAQECCDRCRARKGCNSWTFCGLPVCFGLDTGWNHTFGECWLRQLEDPAKPTFGQRGSYALSYRTKMLHTRRPCKSIDTPGGLSPNWSCPPTHVPWTSGSINVPADPTRKWQTSGGWGNMRIHELAADGTPIESSCTRNNGQACDPKVLGHAG